MNRTRFVSRTIRATGLALVAAVAMACANTDGPTAPAAESPGGAIKGETGIGAEIAKVRAATAQFHEVSRAIAAGYANPLGGTCDQIPIGTMGIHSSNPGLVGSQVLDPEQPEVLLYLPTDEGFELVAVEYLQVVLLQDTTTGAVAPWFSQAPWPATHQVVTPTPQLFGQTFQGPMPGHVPGMPWHWDLHAWVWRNNPSGMFAQWNPAISCP